MSIRTFKSGANRNSEEGKRDIEAYLNPRALQIYCDYMYKHQFLEDGTKRPGDNWQKGFGKDVCAKSLMRHVLDFWLFHRGYKGRETIVDALCAIIFNSFAYLLELEKKHD